MKIMKLLDTKDKILDDESPFSAAKKGKTSMWKAIESLKKKKLIYHCQQEIPVHYWLYQD